MKKVALIGFGAIAKLMVEKLSEHDIEGSIFLDSVLVRENRRDVTEKSLSSETLVVTNLQEIISRKPDVVVECAGQGAVAEYAEAVLTAGIDLMIISTGAFTDDGLRERLISKAGVSGAQILLPSGAIAGIDGMGSLFIGGLNKVRYTSTKPPLAWRATPAEKAFDLENIAERTVLFSGTARDAARLYPKNANLAATVALAGLGFDKTEIQLIADPAVAPNNVGQIEAEGDFGRMTVECCGMPAPDNPKTSATTALSLTYALLRDQRSVVL